MIVTVCMNPAIDKTLGIECLLPGGLNRIQKVEYDAGGKGINVSKTIHALGGSSIATGFLGGNAGQTIAHVLNEQGIRTDFVFVEGETRTNTKVIEDSGRVTELNEPGPVIPKEKLQEMMEKLTAYAAPQTLFVLSGSVPKGVPADIYGKIIAMVHEKGAKVLLDADGELFRMALNEKPEMVKPNKEELQAYVESLSPLGKADLVKCAEKFLETGVEAVTISMGSEGALFVSEGMVKECPALRVHAHSTVGAGDAMVAAMAYAWELQLAEEETIRLCMATSAGAVTTIGTKPPTKELVDTLKTQVEIYEYSVIGSF